MFCSFYVFDFNGFWRENEDKRLTVNFYTKCAAREKIALIFLLIRPTDFFCRYLCRRLLALHHFIFCLSKLQPTGALLFVQAKSVLDGRVSL